jgi:CheY-like chemotaxis protein
MCPHDGDTVICAPTALDEQAPSPPRIPQQPTPRILIVDDDPVVRSLMRDTLEDDGFVVAEAEDGVQACRICEDEVPSLLIVDAVMPNMDGFELCRALRERLATRHIPILMATGLDDHGSIARAYDAGATDFIAKPLNWLILHHRIRYILRGADTLEELRRNQAHLRVAHDQEREQSERFEAALANMSQGLCMFGADGGLIVANQRFRDIFHLPPAALRPALPLIDVVKCSPMVGVETDAAGARYAGYLTLASQRHSVTAPR